MFQGERIIRIKKKIKELLGPALGWLDNRVCLKATLCVCVCSWDLLRFLGPSNTRSQKWWLWLLHCRMQLTATWSLPLCFGSANASLTDKAAPEIGLFPLCHQESKVGSRSLRLPGTMWSSVCFPSQRLSCQFRFHFIFVSLKLFHFPKASHMPVSQEAGSKLRGPALQSLELF